MGGTPYSVDFFLHEPRGALDFTSDGFAEVWPHPAVVAKQYAYYPQTTLHYSYKHATELLTLVGNKIAIAQKLDPAETQCTEVEVIDGEHHRTNKLAPGQYSCPKKAAAEAAARARRLSVLEAEEPQAAK